MIFFENLVRNLKTQVLQFLQASPQVLWIVSLLATALTVISFPVWWQVFAQDIPVQILLTASDDVEYVRVYWNTPTTHSNQYKRVALKDNPSRVWEIQVEALGRKKEQSQGKQINVVDIRTPQTQLDWSLVVPIQGTPWQLETADWFPRGRALVADGRDRQTFYTTIEGGDLSLHFIQNTYSGKADVTVNGERQRIDLYSPKFRIKSLTFPFTAPESNPNQYLFNLTVPNTAWGKLLIVPEASGIIDIERVVAAEKALSPLSHGVFDLPNIFSPQRILRALLASLLSFFWMVGLFVSAVHTWQNKLDKKLALGTYMVMLAIALSGFWLFVFYPGHLTVDSVSQWSQAIAGRYHTWYPPITAMVMWVTRLTNQQPDLFAFLQGFTLWFGVIFLANQVIRSRKVFLIAATCLVLLPSLWIYAATIVSNVFFAGFALISTGLLVLAIRESSQRWFWMGTTVLSIAVMFRTEAIFLVLAPLLISQLPLWPNRRWLRRCSEIIFIVLVVLAPARVVERLPAVEAITTPVGFAFINQYIGTVYNAQTTMSDSALAAERSAMDTKFGTGTFDAMLQRYRCDAANYIVWEDPVIISTSRIDEETAFILNKTASIALQYPIAFLKHKSCNLSYLLQYADIFYFYAIPGSAYSIEGQLNKIGIFLNSSLPNVRDRLLSWLERSVRELPWTIVFQHYIFLIAAGPLLILGLLTRNVGISVSTFMALLSFSAFVIPDAFPDWRHLLFMYICVWVAIFGAIDHGVHKRDQYRF